MATPLNRERVLQAAVALADAEGLEALSMRTLARSLGVTTMAAYKHVRDKADLVDAMIALLDADHPATVEGLDWRAATRARVLTARRAALAHPWLREAVQGRSLRSTPVLGRMDAVAGDLLGGGLSVDLTHHAVHTLGHRIFGFSPEPIDDGTGPVPETEAEQAAMVADMAATYPHMTAIAYEAAARTGLGGCDEDFEFTFALDLILDAVARLHESAWSSPTSPLSAT